MISELGIKDKKIALDGAIESIKYKGKTYELQYVTNTIEKGKLQFVGYIYLINIIFSDMIGYYFMIFLGFLFSVIHFLIYLFVSKLIKIKKFGRNKAL